MGERAANHALILAETSSSLSNFLNTASGSIPLRLAAGLAVDG